MQSFFVALLFLCSFWTVDAIPAWAGSFLPSASIGNLVPGAGYIEAVPPSGRTKFHGRSIRHLSPTGQEGTESNMTAYPNSHPPLYYIHRKQLWQVVNDTTILSVNVLNTTTTVPIAPSEFPNTPTPRPLRIVLGKNQEGVKGSWRYRGTLLTFDFAAGGNNHGLFYSCRDAEGAYGMYTFATMTTCPSACELLTLHGSSQEARGRGQEL